MKFQKLFVSAVTVCVLMGASGAAMAAENCDLGFIVNQVVIDNIRTNQDCVIKGSIITGRVTVDFTAPGGAGPSGVLVMDNNIVLGRVKVVGGGAAIVGNVINSANLRVDAISVNTVVKDNLIKGPGNIIVTTDFFEGDDLVLIESNTVSDGDIRCPGRNVDPFGGQIDALALNNIVPRGNISCFGQLKFGQLAQ